jgi:hypothetical protein
MFMQIELIENPLILRTRNAQTTTRTLHDDRAVRDYSVNDETKSTEEQIRLLLSWRTVLGEIGSSGLGAGQW